MFLKMRKRVTYTNIVLTLILLFAMTGGALAAKRYVITSTSQISPKVLRALQGKDGAQGSVGASGSVGPKGETGAAGVAGEKGATGPRGPKGLEGLEGPEGPEGPKGSEGSPWAAGGTLPKGSSEKGVWAVNGPPSAEFGGVLHISRAEISYSIPLATAPAAANTHVIGIGEQPPVGCKGSVEEPAADEGNLCIFVGESVNVASIFANFPGGAEGSKVGAFVALLATGGASEVIGTGTWAVAGD